MQFVLLIAAHLIMDEVNDALKKKTEHAFYLVVFYIGQTFDMTSIIRVKYVGMK